MAPGINKYLDITSKTEGGIKMQLESVYLCKAIWGSSQLNFVSYSLMVRK
jgi:hypothetical protein